MINTQEENQKQIDFGNFIDSLPTENMTEEQIEKAINEKFPTSRRLTIDEWEDEMDIYLAELEAQKSQA